MDPSHSDPINSEQQESPTDDIQNTSYSDAGLTFPEHREPSRGETQATEPHDSEATISDPEGGVSVDPEATISDPGATMSEDSEAAVSEYQPSSTNGADRGEQEALICLMRMESTHS